MTDQIEVVPHQDRWADDYVLETGRIRAKLSGIIVETHHIGSTAVPGLAAKPIIDVLLEVISLGEVDAAESIWRDLGYEPMGANGIPRRRFFVQRDPATHKRTSHVHAFERDDPNIDRHLKFRDMLREQPILRDEYGALKARLAREHANDRARYTALKGRFVEHTLDSA